MRVARDIFSISTLLIFAACSGGGPNLTTPLPPPPSSHGTGDASSPPVSFAASIFVANTAANDVLVFPKTASGNVAPSGVITQLDKPRAVAFHNGSLYVLSWDDVSGAASIDVFAPGSNTPVRTISGPATGFNLPQNFPLTLAVDASGFIYVGQFAFNQQTGSTPEVAVFAPDASGDVAPTRVLFGGITADPEGLALDSQGRLYVAAAQQIRVYPAGAQGATPPQFALTPQSCGFDFAAFSIGVDAAGTIFDLSDRAVISFAPVDTGAHVLTEIAGSNTKIDNFTLGGALAVDATTVYVSVADTNAILTFPKNANGNVAPASIIQGSNTQLATADETATIHSPGTIAVSP